jgi:hypothetical protein
VRSLIQSLWTALLGALIALLVQGGASSLALVVIAALLVIVLAYWLVTDRGAVTRWPKLGKLPGAYPAPRLLLRDPVIERAMVHSQASGPAGIGVPDFPADFIKVPITNDRRAAVAAEDVIGTLSFRTADGELIAEDVAARWAHTEQAADRSQFARLDDPALNEVRIPAGLTRHLDIATCAAKLGGFRMWTNMSMLMLADPRFQLGDRVIIATVTVRGSNAAEQIVTLRLKRKPGGIEATAE